ncbi:MAG: SIS domain-containing protein [Clostridia bacterium]|nr:SIS domain-containing protein [Clostridia bacterium]
MLYNKYFFKIREILNKVEETQKDKIEESAKLIAESIKKGGVLHVFGCGHSQMYAMEVFYRAGGLVPVNAILTPALSLEPKAPLSTQGERQEGLAKAILDNEVVEKNDIIFIVSTSGRNAVPIEMAIEAKNKGMQVITLTSYDFSKNVTARHKSGKKAYEFADVVLDNCGVLGDAIMEIEGLEAKFGPTSSIIGFTIVQSIIVQTVENLFNDGIKPPIWVSSNLDKGDEINKKYIEDYRNRISCL